MQRLLKYFEKIFQKTKIFQDIELIKINQAGILKNILNETSLSSDIRDYEFKIFSQWGEDGIIQHLINHVHIENKTFIEFGVENFSESNCRFLMMNNNWSGFVIDGNKKNIKEIKSSYYFWKYELKAISEFITKDNINDLLDSSNFEEDLGILSIDIDGNDYYVLDAINKYKPRILITEFNSNFGFHEAISVPYDKNFYRFEKCSSGIYWGASLKAFIYLASKKGYKFVGTNSSSCNAFFVKKELVPSHLKNINEKSFFNYSKYREARDRNRKLNYLNFEERKKILKGLKFFNVIKKSNHSFK